LGKRKIIPAVYEIPDRLPGTRIPVDDRSCARSTVQRNSKLGNTVEINMETPARAGVAAVLLWKWRGATDADRGGTPQSDLADRVGVTHPSRLCAGGAGRDEELELLGRNGRTVKISLRLLAAERVEDFQLLYRLDAFCNRAQAVGSRQCDYR
jgi:hypothetical protein